MAISPLNDEQMSNWVGVKHLPVYHESSAEANKNSPKKHIQDWEYAEPFCLLG